MGKKGAKKAARERRRRTMRVGVLALLCALGVALLGGMAMFNRGAKPDRDMQWYVRDGAMQVAAPALGEGFDASAEERDSEFLRPEEGVRATAEPTPTVPPAPEPVPLETQAEAAPDDAETYAPEDGFETDADAPADADADVGAQEAVDADAEIEPEGDAVDEDYVGQVTLTISAAGDCTFGGMKGAKSYGRFAKYAREFGYDYFLGGVRDIFEGDDLTIINLEGPLTSQTKERSHGFVFKADPECVQILTGSSVELCNVANNHSQDYGVKGLKETAQVLDENGIGYCGYSVAYEKTIKGVRVCALGFTKWDISNEKIAQAVKAYRDKCDLLIVNMHWGQEHHRQFNGEQAATGHAIIDAGADLVLGTHPHVIQGIEKYKDKYIVYSLGNFSFAGNANPGDKRCFIFQQTFSFVVGMNLSRAGCANAGINIIPASISSTTALNDFRPTVLDAEQGAKVLKALFGYSKNFNPKDTLWMKDNYLLANGLMPEDEEDGADASEADLEGEVEEEAEADVEGEVEEEADLEAEVEAETEEGDFGDGAEDAFAAEDEWEAGDAFEEPEAQDASEAGDEAADAAEAADAIEPEGDAI